jgi:hypothetical protein
MDSMKTTKKLALLAVLLVSGFTSHAITNTAIAVSGTNIVLSWPSYGYESYLVQFRQTLDPSDSWSVLTNAYRANSTNCTTLTLPGVVPGTSGSSAAMAAGGNACSMSLATETTGPLVAPTDGSSGGVPLALYPPGFDLSNFDVFDPISGESVSGADYVTPLLQSASMTLDVPMPTDGGSGSDAAPAPTSGFYRVFHIPDFSAGITNHIFNGPTFIPVDYAEPDAPADYVDSTTVLIGGQPTDYAQFMLYTNSTMTNWGVGIYFDRLPNGTNTIQLLTTVRQSDDMNADTPYMVFSNAPVIITIGNLITFTNWDDLIWNNTNFTFKAQTVANVDWEIDIYDWYGNFVNYQTGHSSDGNISWTWNLYDYWSNYRGNPDGDPVFYPYISVTGNLGNSVQGSGNSPNGNSTAGHWTPPAAATYPSLGAWLFGYQDNLYTDGTTNHEYLNQYYYGGIQNMEGGLFLWDITAYDYPIKLGRNYAQTDRDDSWKQLTYNYLGSSDGQIRNFYYNGHGASNAIGGDINIVDSSNHVVSAKGFPGSKAKLTSNTVRNDIVFNKYSGFHFYRFVWLDGCNTAVGDFPEAWGIGKKTNNPDYYRSPANTYHTRPAAFIGWNTEVGGAGWGTTANEWLFKSYWMGNWSVNNGQETDSLSDNLTSASDGANWPSGGSSRLWGAMRLYGYRDIKFNEYNQQGNWP